MEYGFDGEFWCGFVLVKFFDFIGIGVVLVLMFGYICGYVVVVVDVGYCWVLYCGDVFYYCGIFDGWFWVFFVMWVEEKLLLYNCN